MAKIKNEDFPRDAQAIVDRLSKVEDLNKSSAAYLKIIPTFIEDGDGRFAFTLASRAAFMHEYCESQKSK